MKKDNLPLYEAVFNDDVAGVFGISLVENPATQEYFIQLSEDEKREHSIQFATIDEEKKILLGLVLEPNKPIYRNQGGEEFNIIFNSQTVESLAHGFFQNGHQFNSTIEHDEESKVEGIAFVESWIIDDPKKDKSNSYGLEYEKGSWLVAMKVNSDDVWNDYIKSGKVKGFSIDAVVKLKKVNNKTNIKMSLATRLKEASEAFIAKLSEKKEIKLGEVKVADQDVMFQYEGDMLEIGMPIFAIGQEENEAGEMVDVKIPVPVGKYPLDDGRVLVISEEGIVGEIIEPGSTEEPAQPEAPATTVTEQAKETATASADTANSIKSVLIKYAEQEQKIDDINKKLDALLELSENFKSVKAEIEEVKKEVVEFSEAPKSKPKGSAARIEKPITKQERILQSMRNANQN